MTELTALVSRKHASGSQQFKLLQTCNIYISVICLSGMVKLALSLD